MLSNLKSLTLNHISLSEDDWINLINLFKTNKKNLKSLSLDNFDFSKKQDIIRDYLLDSKNENAAIPLIEKF